jgi:putative flippase GtrA
VPTCIKQRIPTISTDQGHAATARTDNWSEFRETKKQLCRFLVIGLSSVFVDLAVYAFLAGFGTPTHWAKGISYIAGMLIGFVGNKFWTFECRTASVSEPVLYVLLYLATLVINVVVNAGVLGAASLLLPSLCAAALAFLIATGVTTVLNFLGMRLVAFRTGLERRRTAIIADLEEVRKEAA